MNMAAGRALWAAPQRSDYRFMLAYSGADIPPCSVRACPIPALSPALLPVWPAVCGLGTAAVGSRVRLLRSRGRVPLSSDSGSMFKITMC